MDKFSQISLILAIFAKIWLREKFEFIRFAKICLRGIFNIIFCNLNVWAVQKEVGTKNFILFCQFILFITYNAS